SGESVPCRQHLLTRGVRQHMLTEAQSASEMRCPAAAGQQQVQPAVARPFLSSSPASNPCRYASAPGALADTFIRLVRPAAQAATSTLTTMTASRPGHTRHPTRPSAVAVLKASTLGPVAPGPRAARLWPARCGFSPRRG